MKSDIDLFREYDREVAGSYNIGYHVLDLLKNALSTDTSEMLDIESCQARIQEIMAYLPLKKRLVLLKKEVGDKLVLSKDGFKLYDKPFSSVDELERAFKMKAFL